MLENQLSETLSLNGTWQFETPSHSGTITIPGAWEAQGYVTDVATYRRTVEIPAEWSGARIYIRFDAVSYLSTVTVNGQPVGDHEGLWAAHEFDITDAARCGEANEIAVAVRKPLAQDSGEGSYRTTLVGFIPYVATTFGGLWQDVTLIAHRAPAIDAVHVEAEVFFTESGTVSGCQISYAAQIVDLGSDLQGCNLLTEIIAPTGAILREGRSPCWHPGSTRGEVELAPSETQLWHPASPVLYTVRLSLIREGQVIAQTVRQIGFRQLRAEADRLFLNSEPFCVRGVLHWGWNPEMLAPIFTDEQIRAEFARVRALGFNLIKLCLFVPSQRFFEIADEEGLLLWLELPLWWQRLTDHLRAQVVREYTDILQQIHSHPSVVIYSLGCELDAHMLPADLAAALSQIVRSQTTGCLLCDNSGSGEAYGGLKLDLADFADYHFYADIQYFTPLCDHFHRDWTSPQPWIFGEYCDADDYRDLTELGGRPAWLKYQGVEGNPTRWAYNEQAERMAALHLPFTDAQLQHISRQQSLAVRKNIIEKTRARRGSGGYVLTGLRDTPISTSGIFDDLNRPKYAAEDFRAFNVDTVLLLERGRSRQWTHGGDRPAPLDRYNIRSGQVNPFKLVAAHAGPPLTDKRVRWQLVDSAGAIVLTDESVVHGSILGGIPREIASLDLVVPTVDQPHMYRLRAELDSMTANEWHIWIYPPAAAEPPARVTIHSPRLRSLGLPFPAYEHPIAPFGDVIITDTLDPVIHSALDQGAKVILLALDANSPLPTQTMPFWRESLKLIHADHPAWGDFPHAGYVDMQFYQLATDRVLVPTMLPGAPVITPLLSRLDARLFTLHHYAVEYQFRHGHMIASTLNLFGGTGDQVLGYAPNIAAQHLLEQWVQYLLSK